MLDHETPAIFGKPSLYLCRNFFISEMDQIVIIGTVALFASLLTFFTGFGVGTLLLPAFALFFPVEVAVLLTAVVHFLNNIFKFVLIGSHTAWAISLRFGIPAMVGAFLGAQLLFTLSKTDPVGYLNVAGESFEIHPVKLTIGVLIIFFALFDLIPYLERISFKEKHLIPGGFASGFFGGLSGHQGALRSAFLIRTSLTKEAFIATGVAISLFVDFTRMSVYFLEMRWQLFTGNYFVLIAASLAAFAGAFAGRFLLRKVTIAFVRKVVSVAIITLGAAIALGII